MILGKTLILTFQEQPGDVFEAMRERIRKQKGRIPKVGIDYLAYALFDTIVDNYLAIIERLGERIEEMEDRILDNPSQAVLASINNYKPEMNDLRKTRRPAREFILQLSRLDSDLIQDMTLLFKKRSARLEQPGVRCYRFLPRYALGSSGYLQFSTQ